MKPDTRAFYHHAVQRVVTHLVTHLDESADLAELAKLACLSPYHFHRVFRGMVGETPLELLRRLRLERAAHELLHTSDPVTAIAFGAGYETHESFTRAFRSAFGEAPITFRRNSKARARLASASGVHFDHRGTAAHFIPSDTGAHTMQIALDQLPSLRLATVPHIGPYNQIGKAFEQLGMIAGRTGLFAHPGAMMIATYDNDPDGTPVDELRSHAGISIPDDVPLPGGTVEQRIDGGTYARYTHIGPFDALGDVWSRFMGEALPASGHMLAEGPALEIYRSDMRTTPKEKLRTDLLVRVEPAKAAV
jgi:AraC family transcriptional regulator